MIRPFRCVPASPGSLTHVRVRSLSRVSRALRSGQLNRPRIQQFVAAEAGVALTAVRVEDPEGRPAARWAGPVAGDQHLRSLADHVSAEPDPRPTGKFQANPGRFADRAGETPGSPSVGRLEDDEADPGSPRQRLCVRQGVLFETINNLAEFVNNNAHTIGKELRL